MQHKPDRLVLTAQIVSAYVSKNPDHPGDVAGLINSVHAVLGGIQPPVTAPRAPVPAVPIEQSVASDHLICLEDGKRLKMLRRHLKTAYGLTPKQYRARWNLPADYPMTAPAYAMQRSALARKAGLGSGRIPAAGT